MASWTSKIENERLVASVEVKRTGNIVSKNGYDPDQYIRDVADEVLTVTVTATTEDELKKKIIAVLEGGL